MPKALSIKPEPYQHQWTPAAKYDEIFTGWAYPPKDYAKWGELVYQWAKHCVERYGRAEVETWYWEMWNEPNIGYWRGTPRGVPQAHDYAVDAVRRALPTARVGGPDVGGRAGGASSSRDFLEHCLRGTNYATGKTGTPIDFISFHAKGAPAVRGRPRPHGHRQAAPRHRRRRSGSSRLPGAEGQADRHRRIRPRRLRRVPGRRSSATATARCTPATPPRASPGSTTWPTEHGVNLEGALTWAFEFEDQPYFAGFRVLATNGIDLPVLNVFRMFGKMGGQRVAVDELRRDVGLDAMLQGRRARQARRRGARQPATRDKSASSPGTTTTTTCRARTRRSS